jgi:hypothetical protein
MNVWMIQHCNLEMFKSKKESQSILKTWELLLNQFSNHTYYTPILLIYHITQIYAKQTGLGYGMH